MRLLLALSISVLGISAAASGSRVGDGGHGVSCGSSPTVLLDFHEATQGYGRVPFFDLGASTEQEYLQTFRDRVSEIMGVNHPSLSIFDQAVSLRYTMWFAHGPLALTDDIGVLPLVPGHCILTQVAIRKTGVFNGILEVDESFWQMATPRERALLLVHEGAHGWFAQVGLFEDSAIRQFVGLLYAEGDYGPTSEKIRELITSRLPVPSSELTAAALRER